MLSSLLDRTKSKQAASGTPLEATPFGRAEAKVFILAKNRIQQQRKAGAGVSLLGALLLAACAESQTPDPAGSALGNQAGALECTADAECDGGMCDRGVCATENVESRLGQSCAASDGAELPNACAAYVCYEKVCHRCLDSQECLGGAQCNHGVCAGGGATGGSCTFDHECESGFCDRDVCAEPAPELTLGLSCDPPFADSKAGEGCDGLSCTDHRCRSCLTAQDCGANSTCNRRRCVGVGAGAALPVSSETPPPPSEPE